VGVGEALPPSCSSGDRAGSLTYRVSQQRGPSGPKLGRPGGDVMETMGEFSTYFCIVLCVCLGCFDLNRVAENLTGM